MQKSPSVLKGRVYRGRGHLRTTLPSRRKKQNFLLCCRQGPYEIVSAVKCDKVPLTVLPVSSVPFLPTVIKGLPCRCIGRRGTIGVSAEISESKFVNLMCNCAVTLCKIL